MGLLLHKKNTSLVISGVILLLALMLRAAPLEDLTRGSLALEEGIAMADASPGLWEVAGSVQEDQGPLKSHLLHFLLYSGRSEAVLRLPALVFDLASILLMFYLGSLLFDRRTALLACFFMAVSLWHIHYASSARNYPLYVFSMLGSTIFLYRAVHSPGLREWLFYAAALVFSFYSFYWGFFFLAAQACWFFVCYGQRKELVKRFSLSFGLFFLTMIPWAVRLAAAFEYKVRQDPWDWGAQCRMIWELLRDHFGGIVGPVPFGATVFVLGFIWIFYFQKKKTQALFLFMLVVIPSFLYVFCQYVLKINIAPRYFFLLYPFFLLMAAAGIMSWRHWALRTAGILVFMLPLLLYMLSRSGAIDRGLIPFDYLQQGEDHAAVASVIEENYDTLEFVIVEPPFAILSVQYYLDKANRWPILELRKRATGERYFVCEHPRVTMLGLEGDLPTIKRLAAAGRLLVVDFGQIEHEENKGEIRSWLNEHAYKIERDYREHGEDLYFISPPQNIPGDYKKSANEDLRELLAATRTSRKITYPFEGKRTIS